MRPSPETAAADRFLHAPRVHRDHRRGAGDRRGLRESRGHIVAEVALIQHDHRRRAAFGGQRQVAFQAAQIEIAVQSADQKDQVDIGRDGLLIFTPSGARRANRVRRGSTASTIA